MTQNRTRARTKSCLGILVILACLVVVTGIILPKIILSQAEQTFGAASPQLSSVQRLYLAAFIQLQSKDLTQPNDPNGEELNISIDQGESVPSIIDKLWEAGLISNSGVFRSYLQYSGLDTSLKAGDYKLSPAMSPIEIASAIQSSVSADVTLTILPGWRSEEIANSIPTSGLNITSEEFYTAVHSHPEGYSFSTCLEQDFLEGFLFPGSYTFSREANTTINDLLPQILMNFEAHVTSELKAGFSTQGLNLCQAVSLASIVQREAVLAEEMPFIASVFYNRLNSGIALESDPTVQYALGYNQKQDTWWTNPLSLNDLKVNNPYNTYQNLGLPPGPISNPGIEALQAVAYPAQTSYYYFRSACDGSGRHMFAETFEEHVSNECP